MTMDYFVELGRTQSPQTPEEFAVIYHQLIAKGKKKDADQLRDRWSKEAAQVSLSEPQGAVWAMIAQPAIELALLPSCSFFLSFTFTLASPYISKDDNPFYVIDNPIVRDKVFHLPLVRATSWKGNLHSALWQLGHDKQDSEPVQRLFGDIRNEDRGQSGRLFFYPTFFTRTSLEIINPHDRKRRVGKNPILFESVPAGAKGMFSLLYTPFDRIGRDEAETRRQAAADLQLVAEGVPAMFLTYGFSAKRTSGFGVAEERLENGLFEVRVAETAPAPPPAKSAPTPAPSLPRYLATPGRLKDEYLDASGAFRERRETELKAMRKADRQEYEKAQKWWEREGKALAERPPVETQPPPEVTPPAPQWLRRTFDSFDQLHEKAAQVAQALQAGGEA